MYLFERDYNRSIIDNNLQQLINEDNTILFDSEYAAVSEVKSYLIQKFDIDEIFKEVSIYDHTITYKAGVTVLLTASDYSDTITYEVGDLVKDGVGVYVTDVESLDEQPSTSANFTYLGVDGALYYTIIPQPRFDINTEYANGSEVYYKDKTYTSLGTNKGVFPDESTSSWIGVDYIVPVNSIADTDYFAIGDIRNYQMTMYLVDISLYHLHKRITPRNIPDIRVKAYDDAIRWLKMCAKGDITPDLIKLQPRSGGRWLVGNRISNNTY